MRNKTRDLRPTGQAGGIAYLQSVTMPVRDFNRIDFRPIFQVVVYGVTPSDVATIGGDVGSRPLLKAVERLGLSPVRYQSTAWDVPT